MNKFFAKWLIIFSLKKFLLFIYIQSFQILHDNLIILGYLYKSFEAPLQNIIEKRLLKLFLLNIWILLH